MADDDSSERLTASIGPLLPLARDGDRSPFEMTAEQRELLESLNNAAEAGQDIKVLVIDSTPRRGKSIGETFRRAVAAGLPAPPPELIPWTDSEGPAMTIMEIIDERMKRVLQARREHNPWMVDIPGLMGPSSVTTPMDDRRGSRHHRRRAAALDRKLGKPAGGEE